MFCAFLIFQLIFLKNFFELTQNLNDLDLEKAMANSNSATLEADGVDHCRPCTVDADCDQCSNPCRCADLPTVVGKHCLYKKPYETIWTQDCGFPKPTIVEQDGLSEENAVANYLTKMKNKRRADTDDDEESLQAEESTFGFENY